MTAIDRKHFTAIRARWCKSREAERDYRFNVLFDKYGDRYPPAYWLTATERRRLETFRRAQDRASDSMFALLERIGGRSWKSLIPHHWVMEELTFEDAITRDRLSVVPPCGYGASERDVESFAGAIDTDARDHDETLPGSDALEDISYKYES